ncbi:hypothetical protein ACROYT_G003445 [Oculina patagonica]
MHIFHAFTGCDQHSKDEGRAQYGPHGCPMEKPLLLSWSSTKCLVCILLERFVVLFYDQTSPCQGDNDARKVIFCTEVNGDGHNPSQMHGSLGGPHHLKHQQHARELVK